MSPGFLPCFWLLATEPTDRALAGWCPVPSGFRDERAALVYVAAQAAAPWS